jgi:hypothetical protein
VDMPLSHSFSAIQLELPMVSGGESFHNGAVLWGKVMRANPRDIDARGSSCRPPETDAANTALQLLKGLWGLDLTSTLAPRLAAFRQPGAGVQCRTPGRHGGVSAAALKRREAGQGRSRARQPGAGAKGAKQGRL